MRGTRIQINKEIHGDQNITFRIFDAKVMRHRWQQWGRGLQSHRRAAHKEGVVWNERQGEWRPTQQKHTVKTELPRGSGCNRYGVHQLSKVFKYTHRSSHEFKEYSFLSLLYQIKCDTWSKTQQCWVRRTKTGKLGLGCGSSMVSFLKPHYSQCTIALFFQMFLSVL